MLKQTFLTVPAAAMMLGASQAQTSIGINFAGGAYATSYGTSVQYNGNTYTYFGPSYFSGYPVTAKAFGLAPSNWYTSTNGTNPNCFPYNYSANGTMVVGPTSSLTVNWTSPDCWGTHIGLDSGITNSTGYFAPTPGNNEVTWGFLDNGSAWSVNMSGLNATFPHGYVIQCISASGDTGTKLSSSSQVTDGASFTNSFNIYSVDNGFGLVGLQILTNTFTSDAITLSPNGSTPALAGFIVTDEPVVSMDPATGTNDQGSTLILNVGAIGIPPLSYQWRFNGVPITGATSASYTNTSVAPTDAGNYDVVVTNLYGTATSVAAALTVNETPVLTVDLPSAVTNYSTLNARFLAVVGGAPPLVYSWTKNGLLLTNTNSVLNLTNLQASDAGSYQVVVTNSFGSVTSSVANLTVIPSLPPYEGFDYSAGDVNGQNGGTGWGGAWSLTGPNGGGHSVITPGLTYSPSVSSLVVTGGMLETATIGSSGEWDDSRSLLGNIGGPGCGTLYFSFIGQFTNSGWETISFTEGTNSFDSLPFVGQGWYNEGWGAGSANSFSFSDFYATNSPSTTLSFVVYRFDFTPTNTQVKIYVNPSSLASEPAAPTASGNLKTPFQFDGLLIRAHQYPTTGAPSGVLDELRFGGTWAAVAPYIPRTSPAFTLAITSGGLIRDSKPVGTAYDGLNYGTTWLASSTGTNIITQAPGLTRTNVEQFSWSNNTQIIIPPNADFNNATNGTISFWMQYPISLVTDAFPGPGNTTGGAMLFDRRMVNTNGTVIVVTPNGNIEFQSVSGAIFTGSKNLVDGYWHHVAVTYGQTTNDTVSLYVDGQMDTSLVNPGNWTWPTNQQIELGRSHDPYWYIFDGQMDDFRIYNRILTQSEVAQIVANDALVDTTALKVRYNFDASSSLYGQTVSWPYGTLLSSPVLGSGAVWTPLTNAVSPLPISPSAPASFFRASGTP
jgi:Concanavalin A-like lectin/glucanases superfamily/Immunoglobulin I-set domain